MNRMLGRCGSASAACSRHKSEGQNSRNAIHENQTGTPRVNHTLPGPPGGRCVSALRAEEPGSLPRAATDGSTTRLDQFPHWIAVIQEVLWSTVVIRDRRGGINPQDMIERGQDVLRIVRPRDRIFAARVGRADILTHLQPAAGEEHAAPRRPMSAAAA